MNGQIPPLPDRLRGWDRYRVGELLGSGGMGMVYRAFDPVLRREVALKILSGDDPVRLARFVREAQAQARVEHPNVCRVWETGEVGGVSYIAMQLIRGEPLDKLAPRLPAERLAVIAEQVAEGLHAAHRIGLVHRDVKPANVMVDSDAEGRDHPYVVDFGLARELGQETLTVAEAVVGTPAYMSPEQACGGVLDRRTDVYGLGATLYQALAGRPPLVAESPLAVMQKVVHEDPPPLRAVAPAVPPDLEAIIMKCLEKEPERRYDSARALAEDLRRFLDGRTVTARRAGRTYAARKWARRHRRLLAAGGAAAGAILVLFGLWLSERRSVARTAALAQRFGQRVEQVEGMLWRARSLPLHDLRPTKRLVRRRLLEIAEETKGLGALARGPGESALGRGYLALNEPQAARAHLQAAWDSGYRPPEVAYALGVTLGRLYERERQETSRLLTKSERRERRRKALAELRDPSLACLEASRGVDVAHPSFLRALLEGYRGREEDAVAHAAEAFAAVPWLYEAKILAGELRYRRGESRREAGRYEEAFAALEEADALFRQATEIARSDERALLGRCRTAVERVYGSVWYRGRGERADFDRSVAACRDAIAVDPDASDPWSQLAAAQLSWGQLELQTGGDPRATLRAAIENARSAEARSFDSAFAASTVGTSYWILGKHAARLGESPMSLFDEGAERTREQLRKHPGSGELLEALGLIALDRSEWQVATGADPRAALEEAISCFSRHVRAAPDALIPTANLSIAYASLLDHEVDSGSGDPARTAALASEQVRRALATNPKSSWALRTEGEVHAALARLAARRGEDPAAEVAEAASWLERSLAASPNDETAFALLATAWKTQAAHAKALAKDARPAAARARDALRRGFAVDPASLELRRIARELDAIVP